MKRLLLLVGIAAILGSCNLKDQWQQQNQGPIPPNTLRLFISDIPMGADLVTTRATVDPETGEDQISSLYLLFFESNASRNGLFVDYVKINGPLTMNTSIDINLIGTQVNVTDAYNILAIANIDDVAGKRYLNGEEVDAWMYQWINYTEREVLSQARAWTTNGFIINPSGLLMNGRVDKAEHQFDLNLLLTRNQARYDVINNVKDEYDLISVQLSNAFPTSSVWNGGVTEYSNAIGRIQDYYRYDNTAGYPDIYGHLYTFENQVASPETNDRQSTCLIIGLKPKSSGSVAYYRANIVPFESAQIIKRNNVYRVTIRNVGGPGAPTPEEAYDFPDDNELDFTINFWDITDHGMIVQDGASIISIPSTVIRIPGDGGTFTYDIFTFTSSPNPVSPLAIRKQTYEPVGGITSTLDGNKLVVSAIPLTPDIIERKGTLELGYAGLTATVSIIQTDATDDFLVVHLPDGGIPRFAPFGGLQSGMLRVEASDEWTATIFNTVIAPDIGGFTFREDAGPAPSMAITEIKSTNASYVTNNRFRVWTLNANPTDKIRESFILVTLDKDPENYAQVVRVSQSAAGGVSIVPSQTHVTFNSMGDGLASVPNNSTSTFNVRPSEIEIDEFTVEIANWHWEIRQLGANDDRARFDVINVQKSTSDPALNLLTVKAVGMNTSGRQYTATLRIYLTDDLSKFIELTLVQVSAGIEFIPNVIPVVAKTGGQTGLISIDSDPSLSWTAAIVTNGGTAPDGRSLVQHKAKLVDQTGTEIGPSDLKSVATDQFRVVFPKVYYPNREVSISATVTVTVEGMTKSITVTQNPLTSQGAVGYGMTGTPAYGGMGNTYNRGWDGAGANNGSMGLAQIPGYSQSGVGNMNATIAANVTYLHATPHISGSNGTNYSWAAINNYIDTRDAWTVLQTQDNNGVGPMNNVNSPTKRNGAGYGNVTYTGSANPTVYQGYGSNPENQPKVYRFVMDKGHTPLTPAQVASFYSDAVSCVIPAPWPASAVVLTARNGDTHAMLIVDIKNKFLWIGESQQFWYDTYLSNNRGVFLDNLMYFIGNAMKYGSHFTDLLLEDDQPGAQPAPWDTAHWGANAGVPSK